MKYVSLARLTLSLVSCTWSSGSSCKSCKECPGLQKCSATPDVSVRLSIMSRRCSLNLSLMRRPVCPMYWQSIFSLRRHCLHCSRYMTLVELQSRLCRMSKVLLVFKNVTVRVPSCMYWHLWQLRRDGHLDIPLGVVVASFFILARTRYSLRFFGLRLLSIGGSGKTSLQFVEFCSMWKLLWIMDVSCGMLG